MPSFFVLFSPGELVDYFELLSADLVLFGFDTHTHTHKKTESVLRQICNISGWSLLFCFSKALS